MHSDVLIANSRVHGDFLLGTHVRHGRLCYVKALAEGHRDDAELRRGLRKEFELHVMLRHQGIVRCLDYVEESPIGPYILMDYIDGKPLDDVLAGNPSRRCRSQLWRQLLDAVDYMGAHGVVHRDLKPDNIMVTERDGDPVLSIIDFSLADSASMVIGKGPAGNRAYGDPRQFEPGATASPTDDVYAVCRLAADIRPGLFWRITTRFMLWRGISPRASVAGMRRLHGRLKGATWGVVLLLVASIAGLLAVDENVAVNETVVPVDSTMIQAAVETAGVKMAPADSVATPLATSVDEAADNVAPAVKDEKVSVKDTATVAAPKVAKGAPSASFKALYDKYYNRYLKACDEMVDNYCKRGIANGVFLQVLVGQCCEALMEKLRNELDGAADADEVCKRFKEACRSFYFNEVNGAMAVVDHMTTVDETIEMLKSRGDNATVKKVEAAARRWPVVRNFHGRKSTRETSK